MAKTILYHGTIHLFDTIELSKGKGYKDFGPGFYTTEVKQHAINLGKRNKQIEIERLKVLGMPTNNVGVYLYEYQFYTENLNADTCKIFKEADLQWVEFILLNRNSKYKAHSYEIVQGPTADDDTSLTLKAFRNGIYGDPGTPTAKRILLQMLEAVKLPTQTYFGTEGSAEKLRFIGRSVIG